VSDCKFCDIVNGKRDGTFVHRDDLTAVFMDIRPINAGHMLIVPNEHASYLSDLNPETGAQMFRIAQKMTASLRRSALRCEGVNLFLADGEAALQDVFHVHLHVIPRFKGDGFGLTFADTYYARPSRTELESAAEKIKEAIEQLASAEADKPRR
jgi:histidine triad (HIT) family protein